MSWTEHLIRADKICNKLVNFVQILTIGLTLGQLFIDLLGYVLEGSFHLPIIPTNFSNR